MTTPQWAWASHQPLIKAVTEIYKPQFVLESGVGLYSTPLFAEVKEYIGVDTDNAWREKVLEKHPNLNILFHSLGENIAIRHWQISDEKKANIILFYLDLMEGIKKAKAPKLLFVDGATCTRMLTINTVWEDFDIIMYHDSQPRIRRVYGYDKLKIDNSFHSYQLRSTSAWTGLLIKEGLQLEGLGEATNKYIKVFEKEWKVRTGMKLTKG